MHDDRVDRVYETDGSSGTSDLTHRVSFLSRGGKA